LPANKIELVALTKDGLRNEIRLQSEQTSVVIQNRSLQLLKERSCLCNSVHTISYK